MAWFQKVVEKLKYHVHSDSSNVQSSRESISSVVPSRTERPAASTNGRCARPDPAGQFSCRDCRHAPTSGYMDPPPPGRPQCRREEPRQLDSQRRRSISEYSEKEPYMHLAGTQFEAARTQCRRAAPAAPAAQREYDNQVSYSDLINNLQAALDIIKSLRNYPPTTRHKPPNDEQYPYYDKLEYEPTCNIRTIVKESRDIQCGSSIIQFGWPHVKTKPEIKHHGILYKGIQEEESPNNSKSSFQDSTLCVLMKKMQDTALLMNTLSRNSDVEDQSSTCSQMSQEFSLEVSESSESGSSRSRMTPVMSVSFSDEETASGESFHCSLCSLENKINHDEINTDTSLQYQESLKQEDNQHEIRENNAVIKCNRDTQLTNTGFSFRARPRPVSNAKSLSYNFFRRKARQRIEDPKSPALKLNEVCCQMCQEIQNNMLVPSSDTDIIYSY